MSDVIGLSWTVSKSCKPHNKKHGQACVNKSKVCGYKSRESFAAAAEKRPANDSPRRLVFSYLPQKPTEQAVACTGRLLVKNCLGRLTFASLPALATPR